MRAETVTHGSGGSRILNRGVWRKTACLLAAKIFDPAHFVDHAYWRKKVKESSLEPRNLLGPRNNLFFFVLFGKNMVSI